jgi:predicted ATPase
MRDQGRTCETHDLLAPVYAWFTEGFATKDLKDTKAVLEEVEPPTAPAPVPG